MRPGLKGGRKKSLARRPEWMQPERPRSVDKVGEVRLKAALDRGSFRDGACAGQPSFCKRFGKSGIICKQRRRREQCFQTDLCRARRAMVGGLRDGSHGLHDRNGGAALDPAQAGEDEALRTRTDGKERRNGRFALASRRRSPSGTATSASHAFAVTHRAFNAAVLSR
jgi:hypothetical protein